MHPASIVAAALSFGFAALALKLIADANRKDREREEDAPWDYFISWGDVPFVPLDMRLARNLEGGESTEQGGRAVTGLVAHHDKDRR